MDLSVVVPTLNGRDRLTECLDALAERARGVEVVVVNGPSTDGTSGLAREHPAVDRLVELAERNLNAARNAGIDAARGDAVVLVGDASVPEPAWLDTIRSGLAEGAEVVTGPVHRPVAGGVTTQSPESQTIAGRHVTFFDGGNVTFARRVVDALDGFDEFLDTGGARDAAHRLAGLDFSVSWRPDAAVLRTEASDVADRTASDADAPVWGLKYRSLAYRMVKNYGLRPTIASRALRHAGADSIAVLAAVVRGGVPLSAWTASGRDVVTNLAIGTVRGVGARWADRTPRRNPHGLSSRAGRAVAIHDC